MEVTRLMKIILVLYLCNSIFHEIIKADQGAHQKAKPPHPDNGESPILRKALKEDQDNEGGGDGPIENPILRKDLKEDEDIEGGGDGPIEDHEEENNPEENDEQADDEEDGTGDDEEEEEDFEEEAGDETEEEVEEEEELDHEDLTRFGHGDYTESDSDIVEHGYDTSEAKEFNEEFLAFKQQVSMPYDPHPKKAKKIPRLQIISRHDLFEHLKSGGKFILNIGKNM